MFSLWTICSYYLWAPNVGNYYLLNFDLISIEWVSVHFHSVPVGGHRLSVFIFIPSIFVFEIYLHLWYSLKFLQDMTILYSFCSLSVVMAMLCVTIIESLLRSQQSCRVSLVSMLISILCKNLPLIRKTLPSPWPLLPIWSPPEQRKQKQTSLCHERKQAKEPAPVHTITPCMALGMAECPHSHWHFFLLYTLSPR